MAMSWRNIKLGLCPIGKFVFSHEDACRYKAILQAKLKEWNVDFVDLEGVLPDGLVRDQKHVEAVVEHFRKENVDAVFLPHCNFGTEGAAGMIAKKLGKPVLLWGPRDGAPQADGSRLRDTLCGMFATSKVLHKLNVPFTYIENCDADDPKLKRGVIDFLRVVSVVKAFRTMRIGHVGGRIDFFWTTKVNESQLLERFGIEVLPIDLVSVLKRVKEFVGERRDAYAAEIVELKKRFTIEHFANDDPLMNFLALRDFYIAWAAEHKLSAICVESFPALVDELGGYTCLASALAHDAGIPIIGESDIHGGITSVMLEAAASTPTGSFFADLTVRHPQNDNGVLLWHAESPLSLIDDACKPRLGKHWILPSPLSGMAHWRLKRGNLTVARFDGDQDTYQLIVGKAKGIDGPDTLNVYVWAEVDDWPKWEFAFMQGPYIHHVGVLHEHVDDILFEACRYLDGVNPDYRLSSKTSRQVPWPAQ